MTRFTCLFLSLCLSLLAQASHDNETQGARAKSLGGSGVTLVDGWSGVNNQGALGLIDEWNFAAAYQNNFLLPELGLKALAVTAPVGNGAFSLTGHSFGYSQYTENRIGLGYGRQLSDKLALGVQLNYCDTRIGDVYGNRGTIVAEIGILVMPSDRIRVGAHVYNPTRSKLADFDDERIPSILNLGVDYRFSDKVLGIMQIEKDIDRPINVKSGIEYQPVDNFDIRIGFESAQRSLAFGFGYQVKGILIDLSAHWNQTLGYGTTASLGYVIQKKSK